MERFLDTYIERLRPLFSNISPEAAHEMASAFLAFKFGLYANAARECSHALSLIPEGGPHKALKKALSILRVNAEDRDSSQVNADLSVFFSDDEKEYLAINLPSEKTEDPGTLNLDNALIMIYAVALIMSPEDEEPLEEHRRLIVRMLVDYKKALGLDG
jgi:hypothetical protein